MADSHPFANAGLGMFGSAERQFAGRAMQGGNTDSEFLGGLLKFMGVGEDTSKKIQNFSKNPFAPTPQGPGYGPLANAGPMISNEGIEKGGGFNPAAGTFDVNGYDVGGGFNPAGIAPPQQPSQFTGQGMQYKPNMAPVAPMVTAPVWNPEVERQKNQQIVNSLVPRNLTTQ